MESLIEKWIHMYFDKYGLSINVLLLQNRRTQEQILSVKISSLNNTNLLNLKIVDWIINGNKHMGINGVFSSFKASEKESIVTILTNLQESGKSDKENIKEAMKWISIIFENYLDKMKYNLKYHYDKASILYKKISNIELTYLESLSNNTILSNDIDEDNGYLFLLHTTKDFVRLNAYSKHLDDVIKALAYQFSFKELTLYYRLNIELEDMQDFSQISKEHLIEDGAIISIHKIKKQL